MSSRDFTEWCIEQDRTIEGPHGWIQWKGTDVCIDIRCTCGHTDHYDGEFFYFFKCNQCGRRYSVGQTIKLSEITDDVQAKYADAISKIEFATGDPSHHDDSS